jgi:hypothetical protein
MGSTAVSAGTGGGESIEDVRTWLKSYKDR